MKSLISCAEAERRALLRRLRAVRLQDDVRSINMLSVETEVRRGRGRTAQEQ